MNIEEYDRKPFTIRAVQVDLDNYQEVAEWSKGQVEMVKTRMLGTETMLPCIKLRGTGEMKGKNYVATLGCYIVELKGSFRVYKPAQFNATFEKKRPKVYRGTQEVFDSLSEDARQDLMAFVKHTDEDCYWDGPPLAEQEAPAPEVERTLDIPDDEALRSQL